MLPASPCPLLDDAADAALPLWPADAVHDDDDNNKNNNEASVALWLRARDCAARELDADFFPFPFDVSIVHDEMQAASPLAADCVSALALLGVPVATSGLTLALHAVRGKRDKSDADDADNDDAASNTQRWPEVRYSNDVLHHLYCLIDVLHTKSDLLEPDARAVLTANYEIARRANEHITDTALRRVCATHVAALEHGERRALSDVEFECAARVLARGTVTHIRLVEKYVALLLGVDAVRYDELATRARAVAPCMVRDREHYERLRERMRDHEQRHAARRIALVALASRARDADASSVDADAIELVGAPVQRPERQLVCTVATTLVTPTDSSTVAPTPQALPIYRESVADLLAYRYYAGPKSRGA